MFAMRAKDLYDVNDLCHEEVMEIFEESKEIKKAYLRGEKIFSLKDKTVCNLFVEPSTRTKNSFELAEKYLSMNVLNFNTSSSAFSKKETLKDTILTMKSMKIDLFVVRHKEPGTPAFIRKYSDASIINAGDGLHAHPTQAILDAFTMYENFNSFKGLKVSIIGDFYHSRVVRSNIKLLNMLGADVTICSPTTLSPREIRTLPIKYTYDLKEAIKDADVVMGLRMQLERQSQGLFPSLKEYNKYFGIKEDMFETLANKDAILMHPGPINRGVELSGDIADKPYSKILDQVQNGVITRIALIKHLLGGDSL